MVLLLYDFYYFSNLIRKVKEKIICTLVCYIHKKLQISMKANRQNFELHAEIGTFYSQFWWGDAYEHACVYLWSACSSVWYTNNNKNDTTTMVNGRFLLQHQDSASLQHNSWEYKILQPSFCLNLKQFTWHKIVKALIVKTTFTNRFM